MPGAEAKSAWTGRSVLVEADDPISESKDTEEYAPCAGPVLNKCKMKGQTAKKKEVALLLKMETEQIGKFELNMLATRI